ncbi:small membrane protein YniD [Rahnella sp. PCH160]
MMAKHWKMVVVLLCICGALMLLRWAAMIWG